MTVHPYHRKLARVLDRMGSLYTTSDILAAIAEGWMQSFTENDSWAITRMAQFPRARPLETLAAVGDLNECRILHDRILQFAREANMDLVSAYGRRGWMPDAKARGWKVKAVNYLYHKEM
jgi:hypothetical protein